MAIVVFGLGLITMGYHDGRLAGPPTNAEAAAAVLRRLGKSSSGSAGVFACVAYGDIFHQEDFPPGYIDDLFARFPGLRPVSACDYDARKRAFFIQEPRRQVTMIACEAEDKPSVVPVRSDTARVQCAFVGGGGLNAQGRTYSVSRSLLGEMTVEDLGVDWIS